MKKCSKCRLIKELEDFPPSRKGSMGTLAYCKPCHADYQRELRRKGRLSMRKVKTESDPSRLHEWAAKNPEKVKAHALVRKEIRKGGMERPSLCPKCGRDRDIIAHHEDYSKPLDVEWMCRLCHNDLHRIGIHHKREVKE